MVPECCAAPGRPRRQPETAWSRMSLYWPCSTGAAHPRKVPSFRMGVRTDGRRGKVLCQAIDFMALPGGETSNSLAEQLFEILASWTEYLKNRMPYSGADRAAALP